MLDDTTVAAEQWEEVSRPKRRAKRRSDKRKQKLYIWLVAVLVCCISLVSFAAYKWLEKEITLDIDGEQLAIHTFKKTVDEALVEAGITLAEKDRLDPDPQTMLTDGLVVHITKAFPIDILVDGKHTEYVSTPVFVKDVLAQTSVELQPLDRVEPELEVLVDRPSQIRIVRVNQEEVTAEQTIPYRLEQRGDNNLEKGLRRIVSRGRNGLERYTMRITYEDGVEVNRELLSQEVVRPPVNQIVAMGTIDQVSRGGLNFRFKEAHQMLATAYTHTGRNTASGVYPEVGTVAVDTSVIPMGSRLYVEGYGFAKAADRGGAIVGERIDVFMETKEEARRWGKRYVKVYILE